jgi:hypothetical protein
MNFQDSQGQSQYYTMKKMNENILIVLTEV